MEGEFIHKNITWPLERFGKQIFNKISLIECGSALEKSKRLHQLFIKVKQEHFTSTHLKSFEYMSAMIEKYASDNCQEEIEENKKRISILYDGGQLEKLVAEESSKLDSHNHVKDLPSKAKNILEEIKHDYLSLNKKIDELSEEERFNLNNLWNKRIPEIINKYLRADPEFRTTMKNNSGKTIEDLMVESLSNIHDILNKIQESHSNNVLHEMAAMSTYTKTLKNQR